jgi:hypothetical protein
MSAVARSVYCCFLPKARVVSVSNERGSVCGGGEGAEVDWLLLKRAAALSNQLLAVTYCAEVRTSQPVI